MADAGSWTLVIHGGAGVIERSKLESRREAAVHTALRAALDAGSTLLAAGGAALDAVEAAVRVLEDDPHFNAGRGAVFTADGRIELDAAIMDGATRAAGAVALASGTRNPVSLARAVMEKSEHVMLAGAGADAFAEAQGLEQAPPEWFHTEDRWRQLQVMLGREQASSAFDKEVKFGTVGAVARDSHGNLAAATSTGGLTGKQWGRIGDSPIIGAGTWADNRAGAVSATGSGEFFIRTGAAHEICARMRLAGANAQQAADAVLAELGDMGGSGGVILVGADGTAAISFNSPGMYRAMARAGGEPMVAIYGDE